MQLNKRIIMIKKYYLSLFILFLLAGCSTEFKPSKNLPSLDSPINEIFADSINNMNANIKFEFENDSCKSISATYGDDNDIYYQIIWIDKDLTNAKKCMKLYIYPKFKKYRRVLKKRKNFDLYAENDSDIAVSWINKQYIFFMSCKKRDLNDAVSYSNFLYFK